MAINPISTTPPAFPQIQTPGQQAQAPNPFGPPPTPPAFSPNQLLGSPQMLTFPNARPVMPPAPAIPNGVTPPPQPGSFLA